MSEPGIGEISADEMEELAKNAVRRDRTSMFKEINPLIEKVSAALEALPFNAAMAAMKDLSAILAVLTDELGEHMGECEFCEEPVFATGSPDDDVEYAGDLGWAHRTCMDRARVESPELFSADDEDGD